MEAQYIRARHYIRREARYGRYQPKETSATEKGAILADEPEKVSCSNFLSGCRNRQYDDLEDEEVLIRKKSGLHVTELKRCTGCRRVHYCSAKCQREDWQKRHAAECVGFQQATPPQLHAAEIHTASFVRLYEMLVSVSSFDFVRGEEREPLMSTTHRANVREIGKRLYSLGGNGKDLMFEMHALFRRTFEDDPIRYGDGKLLEWAWHGIGDWYA
mmetsp:Transcript_26569/g.44484  ORF Transcript_26569/g.44484 Transcript_26569/m.44484 type:complete len:215 (-) Transcript_26569:138-782(-)